MSLNLNKARTKDIPGLVLNILNAFAKPKSVHMNSDGTHNVIVDFYEDQAAHDGGAEPFDTFSYQVTLPPSIEAQIVTQLKKLTDFDQAT